MVAKPSIVVSHVEELFHDDLGQYWSPAQVTLSWPAVTGIRGPSVTMDVVATARPDMTLDQLYRSHLSAAHDVLTAALLAMEDPAFEAQTDLRPTRARSASDEERKREAPHNGSGSPEK